MFNSQGQAFTIRHHAKIQFHIVRKKKTLNPLKAPPKTPHLVALGLGEVGEDKKVKKYMKQKIIKNGVTLKLGFQVSLLFFNLKFHLNWTTLKTFPSDQTSDPNIWLTVSETQFILNFYIVLQRNRFETSYGVDHIIKRNSVFLKEVHVTLLPKNSIIKPKFQL